MTPTEIRYDKSARSLRVVFDDGFVAVMSAEHLRVNSPSAEVQGHGRPVAPVTGKENVAIVAIEPIGNYAVRLVFDDGHDSGLYSWPVLAELGRRVQSSG